jgi:hypothetical protein
VSHVAEYEHGSHARILDESLTDLELHLVYYSIYWVFSASTANRKYLCAVVDVLDISTE